MKSNTLTLFFLLLFSSLTFLFAQQPIPDFQVNENGGQNYADQLFPSISSDGSGNYVITWVDDRNVNDDIYVQRYGSDGRTLGPNFKVNDDQGSAHQGYPSISSDGSGNFVITWEDRRNGNRDIYAQRYSSDGSPLGTNFKVNDDTVSAYQRRPSISADGSGNYVITWLDSRNGQNIYAQRYSSDGSVLGTNFKVNDDDGIVAMDGFPSIATDNSGNFVITWVDGRNGHTDIYAQRYLSDGSTLGTNFKVNDDTVSASQSYPSISSDGSGNFVITWVDWRNGQNIYAQRYFSDGSLLGSNFKVNDATVSAGIQWYPSISTDGSGNFVITWWDDHYAYYNIYAQRYSSYVIPLGGNIKVNDEDVDVDVGIPQSSIATDSSGNFVITWLDNRNGHTDIYAKCYLSDGTALGSNFKINDDEGSSSQNSSSISTDNSGNFVITWEDDRNKNTDIYAQRHASDGSRLGANFKVNDDTVIAHHRSPSISADGSGNFVITWEDRRNGNGDIYAQRYLSDGTALGSNFKINDDEGSSSQNSSSISTDSSGNFVITWMDMRNGYWHIYAQRYGSDGSALGDNFKVNGGWAHQNFDPSISIDGSGYFVITWTLENGDIYAQRYASNGNFTSFKVNDATVSAGIQSYPSISTDGSGNFVITWCYWRNGNDDIYAQRYGSDGSTLGTNFKVNDDTVSASQWYPSTYPSISSDGSGNFVITWSDTRNVNSDIYAQRYSSNGNPFGSNFRVTNTGEGSQMEPDVKLWNGRIYSTWTDNRTGYDIWTNVLDWIKPVGIIDKERSQIALTFCLSQNYPNPFNPTTTIEFSLPKSEFVELKVYNILGKEVSTLVSKNLIQGNHTYTFDGKNLASGIYYYQLMAGNYGEVKKMILLK